MNSLAQSTRKELDVRLEGVTYTARFAEPLMDLWGKGGQIVRPLLSALSPYGVTLGNIVVHANVANSAEPVITAFVQGNSTVKFAFDRMEFSINSFSQEFFEKLPQLFMGSTSWIKREVPKFKFGSHVFGYNCHAMVKGSTAKEILYNINSKTLETAGLSRGTGSIFHNSVPEKNWNTVVWFDYSLRFPGALFVALSIDTTTETVDYETTMNDAVIYFRSVLAEVNLTFGDFVE